MEVNVKKIKNTSFSEVLEDDARDGTEPKKSDSPIDILSDNCLIEIFSYLTIPEKFIIEKVSKRWKSISEGGWPNIKRLSILTKMDPHFTIGEIEKIIARCGRFLKYLRIELEDEKPSYVRLIKNHCQQIRELIIDFTNLEWHPLTSEYYVHCLSTIFSQCEGLSSLTLLGVKQNFTFDYLRSIKPTVLRKFSLVASYHHTQFPVNSLVQTNLRCLELKNVAMSENGAETFGEFVNLEKLSLKSCSVHINHVQKIKNFERLEELWFDDMTCQVSDEHISSIVEHCQNLRILSVSGLKELSDDCFKDIGKLPKLEELYMKNLPKVTDDAVSSLSHLKVLQYSGCSRIRSTYRLLEEAPGAFWEGPRRLRVNNNLILVLGGDRYPLMDYFGIQEDEDDEP